MKYFSACSGEKTGGEKTKRGKKRGQKTGGDKDWRGKDLAPELLQSQSKKFSL